MAEAEVSSSLVKEAIEVEKIENGGSILRTKLIQHPGLVVEQDEIEADRTQLTSRGFHNCQTLAVFDKKYGTGVLAHYSRASDPAEFFNGYACNRDPQKNRQVPKLSKLLPNPKDAVLVNIIHKDSNLFNEEDLQEVDMFSIASITETLQENGFNNIYNVELDDSSYKSRDIVYDVQLGCIYVFPNFSNQDGTSDDSYWKIVFKT